MVMNAVYRDLSSSSPAEREDLWESAMAALYAPVSVRVARERVRPGSNLMRRQDLDDLAIIDLASTGCEARRTRRMSDRDSRDDLAVLFVRRGYEMVSSGERRDRLAPGGAALWDTGQDTTFAIEGAVLKRNLLVPRPVFAAAVGGDVRTARLTLGGPSLVVLAGLLAVLSRSLPGMTRAEKLAARNATLELLAGAVSRSRSVPDSTRNELRASVDRWIEARLGTSLSPAAAAAAHSISVRTLNRIFQDSGETFGGYVRRRRLERAREDILRGGEPLSAIAHRWRFADASHFTHRFTEQFGCPPSCLRADGSSGRAAGTPHGATEPFASRAPRP
jgi:AraC-like DNA-binding protein